MVLPTGPALPAWAVRLITELDTADIRAKELVSGLNSELLNLQPEPGAWSVGQCLEHLCIFNELFVPAISSSLPAAPGSPVQETIPGWFGRWFLKNYVEPAPPIRHARAPKKIVPAARVEASVLDRFLSSNRAVRELVHTAREHDVNRIRFANPLIPVLRFTVGTGLEIVCGHERRHLLQAERASPLGSRDSNGTSR
jgi:hypothetical protein